jgi:prepilin-type N-terminal cleavage/methylation domain-containing protein
MKKNKKWLEYIKLRTGFTLLELIVVMAIIAILAAAGMASYAASQRQARDSRRKADIQAIHSALEQLYNCSTPQAYPGGLVSPMVCPDGTVVMQLVPDDPQGGSYNYALNGTGGYLLQATLETPTGNDPADPDHYTLINAQ